MGFKEQNVFCFQKIEAPMGVDGKTFLVCFFSEILLDEFRELGDGVLFWRK